MQHKFQYKTNHPLSTHRRVHITHIRISTDLRCEVNTKRNTEIITIAPTTTNNNKKAQKNIISIWVLLAILLNFSHGLLCKTNIEASIYTCTSEMCDDGKAKHQYLAGVVRSRDHYPPSPTPPGLIELESRDFRF